jgi:hypothetical protein
MVYALFTFIVMVNKNNIRFSSFHPSMVRFRSKALSKVLEKVDIFEMYQPTMVGLVQNMKP